MAQVMEGEPTASRGAVLNQLTHNMRQRLTIPRLTGGALAVCLLAAAALPGAAPADDKLPSGLRLLAGDDLGNPGKQPHLTAGKNWEVVDPSAAQAIKEDARYGNLAYEEDAIGLRYTGLNPRNRYWLRVFYLSSDENRRAQSLAVNGKQLHAPMDLPRGKPVALVFELPPETYREATAAVAIRNHGKVNAVASAVELWSDKDEGFMSAGTFVRFRVDALPPDTNSFKIGATVEKSARFELTPEPVTRPGLTPWVDLGTLPGGGNGALRLQIPKGARGAVRFSRFRHDDPQLGAREIGFNSPEIAAISIARNFSSIPGQTVRDRERQHYQATLEQAKDRLFPLTRAPLFFGNSWGHAPNLETADYMAKVFRLLGFNSVSLAPRWQDAAKYERLYGWHTEGQHYMPPAIIHPFDEADVRRQYAELYRKFFESGPGKPYNTPGMRIFQLYDEPGELGVPNNPAANAAFRAWIAAQGATPQLLGKSQWDQVSLVPEKNDPPAIQNCVKYWARRYKSYLTPKTLALAAEGVRANTLAGTNVQCFAALSGHDLYMNNRLPLDMFDLARYPGLMPGISDWMNLRAWFWDSHQAVAFSVAPFNSGARRYGKEFGQPPRSACMMHCVEPSLFRAWTQLGNNCKYISFYNYGPTYNGGEGSWSGNAWVHYVVHHTCNQAALIDDLLGPGQMRPSHVGLLYARSSEYLRPANNFAERRALFLGLAHDYFQPDLLTEEQIAQEDALPHYAALLVADINVARAAQERILQWVRAGGLLWTCADAMTRDEYDADLDLLASEAKLARAFEKPDPPKPAIEAVPGELELEKHTIERWAKVNVRWDGARLRARYSDGSPAWLEGSLGKGKIVLIGHRAGLTYAANTRGRHRDLTLWSPAHRAPFVRPLLEAGIPRELELRLDGQPFDTVMAQPLTCAAGTAIILYNMQPTWPEPQNLEVILREPAPPHSVQWVDEKMNLADLKHTYADGRLRITLPVLRWSGAMLAVRRAPPAPDNRLAEMRQAAEKHLAATNDWQALSAGAWFAGFFPAWGLGPKIAPLLQHESWAVRRSAAEALGRLGYADGGPALRAALDRENDWHVQADLLVALARVKHREAKALCREYADRPDSFLRQAAEQAAKYLDPPPAP